MRILVVGAGAIGGFYGSLLTQSGADVTFLARGATLERLRAEGITLKASPFGSFSVPVAATDDLASLEPFDLVLFAVKAYDLENAAHQIAPLVGPGSVVVAIQNGIDHPQRLEAILGEGRIVPGVVYVSTTVPEPGRIVYEGGPGLVQIGEIAPHTTDRLSAIANVLRATGVPVETHADLWPCLWTKFASICAMSGVSALTRLTYPQLFGYPEGRQLFHDALDEVVLVALAAGADIPRNTAELSIRRLEQMPNPMKRGSMAYDLLAGRRIEIDALNGMVVQLGDQLGVPTPINRVITSSLLPFKDGPPSS